jgi:hypothetical protein
MKAQHWLSRQYFGGIVTGIGFGIIVTLTLINPIWAPLEHKPDDGTRPLVSTRDLVHDWSMVGVFICFFVGDFIAKGGYQRRSKEKRVSQPRTPPIQS